MRTILVTGGAGFIGLHLVEKLIADTDYRIISGTRSEESESRFPGRLTEVHLDIMDRESLSRAFSRGSIDTVFHLAAYTNLAESMKNPALCEGINEDGTRNVCQAAERADVRRIVYLSTSAVYGELPKEGTPIDEEHIRKPGSVYGRSKLAGELVVQKTNLEQVIFRGASIYGPGQKLDGGIVPKLYTNIKRMEQPVIRRAVRDFIYVSDVAEALMGGLHCSEGIYNVGSGAGRSTMDVWELVARECRELGMPVPEPRIEELPSYEVKQIILSNNKIREELGWQPAIPLEEGISRSIIFYGDRH